LSHATGTQVVFQTGELYGNGKSSGML